MVPLPRPLIAVNGELSVEGTIELRLRQSYARAIWDAGGLAVAIPPLEDTGFVESLLRRVDGVLLSGGDDFDTDALGLGPIHPQAEPVPAQKQRFDLSLARASIAAGIPVLGICYGMQLLALTAGATLHQHLPEDLPGAREHRAGALHEVLPVSGSKLAAVVGVGPLMTVSRHHQAIAALPPDALRDGWQVSARDDQGLIEAVERDPPGSFLLGVQWHPELSGERSDRARNQAIFRAFVDAARDRSERASRPLATQP